MTYVRANLGTDSIGRACVPPEAALVPEQPCPDAGRISRGLFWRRAALIQGRGKALG